MNHYAMPGGQPWLAAAMCGAVIVGCGILATLIQFCVSVHNSNVNMMPIQMTPEPARSHE